MKLPRRIRQFIVKHQLLTDVITLIGVYYLLGGTLTALFAASLCGLGISAMLYISNHKEDFLYLEDAKEILIAKIHQLKELLNTYGTKYRNARLQTIEQIQS
jgi:hypothetical protein